MKLVKLLPAMAAAVVLAACSSAKTEAPAAAPVVKSEKTVVYACAKKNVKAVYQFEDQKAVSAKLTMGKVTIGDLVRTDREDPTFESDAYRWSLDSGFALDNATKTVPVMLTQKGEKEDKIVAKSCKVLAKATAKANQ